MAPWAIVGDHGSSRKDTSESGIGFLLIPRRFWDPISKVFLAPRAKQLVFCVLVSRSLVAQIVEPKSGRLRLPKQGFGVRGIAKTKFSQKSEF